jgi:integrase
MLATLLQQAGRRLTEFLGASKPLREITAGDADRFLYWLKKRYADATAGRTLKRAKQFFRAAQRQRLIGDNAFADMKAPGQTNESRKRFISREDSAKVIEACPDAQWRLIVALARYGGLRTPGETLALERADVDWERDRIRICSPKTGERFIPIFPELRPYLLESVRASPRRNGESYYAIPRWRPELTDHVSKDHQTGRPDTVDEALSQSAGNPRK